MYIFQERKRFLLLSIFGDGLCIDCPEAAAVNRNYCFGEQIPF